MAILLPTLHLDFLDGAPGGIAFAGIVRGLLAVREDLLELGGQVSVEGSLGFLPALLAVERGFGLPS